MTVIRGSTHLLQYVKEATFGTTPPTPNMIEIPMVNFQPKDTQTEMRSAQIRTHPFVDRIMYGRFQHDIQVDFELQTGNHDGLLETCFGSTISAKSLAFTDALKSVSLESAKGGGSALFDQYTGTYFGKLSVQASSSDTTGVKSTLTGMAKAGTLDAGSTLASTQTAATSVDPYCLRPTPRCRSRPARLRDCMTGNFDIERTVDPLMLWASRTPREFVPSDVKATGKITVPYDGSTQSTIVAAFSDAALVFNFNNVGSTVFRKFTFPKAKLLDMGRQVNTRGAIMQEIDWEAYYDAGASNTVCTMTTN